MIVDDDEASSPESLFDGCAFGVSDRLVVRVSLVRQGRTRVKQFCCTLVLWASHH